MAPAACIINSGLTTAVFPLKDLTFRFRFPLYPSCKLLWTRRSETGVETRGSVGYDPAGGLTMDLEKWNLYIVTADRSYRRAVKSGDYDGDGTADIGIFRPYPLEILGI